MKIERAVRDAVLNGTETSNGMLTREKKQLYLNFDEMRISIGKDGVEASVCFEGKVLVTFPPVMIVGSNTYSFTGITGRTKLLVS